MENQEKPSEILSPPLSLKRKRPPGLEIPNVLRKITADVAEKNTESLSGPGFGVFSIKGKKRFSEDAYKVVSFGCSNRIKGFFGVYDGHGGRKAADFVSENLHTNIFEMLKNCTSDETKEEAVKAGYLKTDKDFLKQGVSSGACCVAAFIEGDNIVISNLGDCRAVLCRDGVAEALTTDHRAGNNDEQKRIESKGGYVDMHRGAWRVHGVLSVSRSIGDAHLKEWVVAEPDTKILQLSQDTEYLILASDGLWEKVENQEAVDIVMGSCRKGKKTGPTKHDENVGKFIKVPKSSPISKLQNKKMGFSPLRRKIVRRKENEDDFPSENEGPPPKIRRVSFQFQDHENSSNKNSNRQSSSCVLVNACNELVNLALSRSSLDDITVMIVDLSHFK